jgi:hypothetical protein
MVSCQTVKDLFDLSQQITVKFKQSAKLSIKNRNNLVITFENSPLADLPSEERSQFAHSVAQFAYQHYAHSEALNTVGVVFQSRQVYGPVKITKTDPMYIWNVTELIGTAEDTTFSTN